MIDKEDIDGALCSAVSASTVDMECQCGVLTFNHEVENIDELRAEAEEKPDEYVEVDYSIPWFFWGDEQIVVGCSCEKDQEIGRLIWGHRYFIANFLSVLAAKNLRKAHSDVAEAQRASSAVEG